MNLIYRKIKNCSTINYFSNQAYKWHIFECIKESKISLESFGLLTKIKNIFREPLLRKLIINSQKVWNFGIIKQILCVKVLKTLLIFFYKNPNHFHFLSKSLKVTYKLKKLLFQLSNVLHLNNRFLIMFIK